MKPCSGMKSVWWPVLGGLVLLLPFLYIKSQAIDNQSHLAFIKGIDVLKELNVTLKQTLIETRLEMRPSYDELVYAMEDNFSNSHEFPARFQMNMSAASAMPMGEAWRRYTEYLDRQRIIIEEFKSHYAVLKNSIHYLPVVVKEFTDLSKKAGAPPDLEATVHGLLDEILIMNLDRGFQHFARLRSMLRIIRSSSAKAPASSREALQIVILHGEAILFYKEEVDELLTSALGVPVASALDEVLEIHLEKFDKLRAEAGNYGRVAFAAAAVLILMVVFILYRLNVMSGQLHRSLTDLSFQKYALDQHAIVSIADVKGRITYVNQKFREITGFAQSELIGENHRIVKSEEQSPAFFRELWRTIANGQVWHGDIRNRARDGSYYWVRSTIVPFLDDNGKPFQYASIRTDITKQKNMEMDLGQARDEAESASRMKSEFLANMSHEIRTPMNAVIGLSHLALETDLDHKQKDYLSKISSSANSLLAIINDILDISKIEAGKLTMEKIPFKLEDVLDQVSTTISAQANEKGLVVDFPATSEIQPNLIGDPLRLRQVLINIGSNAVKFTDQGTIKFLVKERSMTREKIVLQFEVEDTGIGLSETQKTGLFQSFSQADTSTTRKYGGTGLGLSICKHLVELMGGEIGVDSEPGKGSVFHFSVEFGIGDEASGVTTESTEITASSGVTNSIAGARVLVAEDNRLNQQVAREFLLSHGLITTIVENGRDAVNAVKDAEYDIILMDIQMPVMDGLQATAEIRKNPRYDSLPIIAMTAHAMAEDREMCLQTGMNDHITKPIDPKQFATVLKKWIKPGNRNQESITPLIQVADTIHIPSDMYGINIESGLRWTDGNRHLYAGILDSFRDDQQDAVECLHQALREEDLETARFRIHSVKGLAATIGAEALSRYALRLEESLNSGNAEKVFSSQSDFNVEMSRVLEGLKAVRDLAKVSATEDTPPVTVQVYAEARKLTGRLAILLDEGNLESIQLARQLAELLKNSDEVESLIRLLGRFDFSGAQQSLDKITEILDENLQESVDG